MSKKYCNLYSFVKNHNSDLIPIIEDLCAEGLFKGKGADRTFLNPNKTLIKQLDDLINKGESDEALKKLKSLFLEGSHTTLTKKMYPTFNHKEIDGSSLSTEQSKKFNKWSESTNFNVLDLKSEEFPIEGKEVEFKKTKSKKGSNDISGAKELASRVEVTNELINVYTKNEESNIFAYTLNSLLTYIQKKDKKVFDHVHKLLDPNMIVSWYIMVQPTARRSDKHIPDQLFASWAKKVYKNPIKSVELIKELISSNNYDVKELKKTIEKRKEISGVGLKETINDVVKAYDSNYDKLLDDELRFRFSDLEELDGEDIMTLNLINWDSPKSSLLLFGQIPKSNLSQSELYKVISQFIKSNAFLYTPYNDDIINKIKNTISGAGSANKSALYICGGSLREPLKQMSCGGLEFSLQEFVGGLSTEQIDELKSYL
jgi:hypothetical protein